MNPSPTPDDGLLVELKLWAASPRVPEKVQLLILEAIGRLSAPSEMGAPKGFIRVPEKPVAWRREWDGDDSDLGQWIYEDERPSDGYIWQALYAVEPE